MADFAVGEKPTATKLNQIFKLFAAGGQLVGGTPPAVSASSAYKVQGGLTAVTTNSAGGYNISYPTPFPSGVLFGLVMSADNGNYTTSLISGNCSLSGLNGVLFLAGTAVNTLTKNLLWMAVGW